MSDLITAGIDEAGRGAWAGPVAAACVILPVGCVIPGLTDSKRCSAAKREQLAVVIKKCAVAWAIGWSSSIEIDEINVLQASLSAMRRAAEGLTVRPDRILVDGNQAPKFAWPILVETIIQGDLLEPTISAASILAKTARDAEMRRLHDTYPEYGFDKHKGYGTRQHAMALETLGPLAFHRQSFAPVRTALSSR